MAAVRKLTELKRACDLMLLADNYLVRQLLKAGLTSWSAELGWVRQN